MCTSSITCFAEYKAESDVVSNELSIRAPDDPNATEFKVTFDSGGGTEYESQIVARGATATDPGFPTKDGYVCDGWYLGDTYYDFNTPVTRNIKLTAKWYSYGEIAFLDIPGDTELPTGKGAKFKPSLTPPPENAVVYNLSRDWHDPGNNDVGITWADDTCWAAFRAANNVVGWYDESVNTIWYWSDAEKLYYLSIYYYTIDGRSASHAGNRWLRGDDYVTELDLSVFDLYRPLEYASDEYAAALFHGHNSVESIDISNFNASKIRTTAYMFGACNELKELYLPRGTIRTTAANSMFAGCSSLRTLDLTILDTRNCTSFERMFQGTDIVVDYGDNFVVREDLDFSWSVENNDTMSMFYGAYTNRPEWDLEGHGFIHSFTTNGSMDGSYCNEPVSIRFYYEYPWDPLNTSSEYVDAVLGYTVVEPPVEPETRDGYLFLGWERECDVAILEGIRYWEFPRVLDCCSGYLETIYVKLNTDFDVRFNYNYTGSTSRTITVQYAPLSDYLDEMPTVNRGDGWVLEGWYTDKEYTWEVTLDSYIIDDTTLYAKWERPGYLKEGMDIYKLFNEEAVYFMQSMVAPPVNAEASDMSEADDGSVVTWYDEDSMTQYWYSSTGKMVLNTDSQRFFYQLKQLQSVSLDNMDFSNVTDMRYFFSYCQSLLSVDFSSVNLTSDSISASYLLSNCKSLGTLVLGDLTLNNISKKNGLLSGTASTSKSCTVYCTAEAQEVLSSGTSITASYFTFINPTTETASTLSLYANGGVFEDGTSQMTITD